MAAKKDDKPKRKAPIPIPIVGVRGSSTLISAPKAIVAGGAALLAVAEPIPGHASPVQASLDQGLAAGVERAKLALRESWDNGNGKIAAGALALMALFGASIDRRSKGFPIRFGRG